MALTKVTGQVIKNTTDVTVGVLTVTNTLAVGGTVSIGGTLTYEDVTNVDAVGLITARNGIVVGSGITLSKDGDGFFTGIVTATSFSGDGTNLTNVGVDTAVVFTDKITLPDSSGSSSTAGGSINVGLGSDLQIFHNGTNSYVKSSTGNLWVGANNYLNFAGGADFGTYTARFLDGGAAELYHNGTKRFETDSDGVRVVAPEGAQAMLRLIGDEGDDNNDYFRLNAGAGTLKIQDASNGSSWEDNIVINAAGSVQLYNDNTLRAYTTNVGLHVDTIVSVPDSGKFRSGNGDDLEIYHDGSHSWIKNTTGRLILQTDGDQLQLRGDTVKFFDGDAGETLLEATLNGSVDLYYNNSKKFETESEGVRIRCSGNAGLRVDGTVADVNPRITFRRHSNDGNNAEAAAIQMTYVAGTTYESGHLSFFTNGDSGSAALSEKVRFQNDGVKYFDNTFDTTANNARKSYFTNVGQLIIGRNAHESYIVFQDVSNTTIGNIVRGAGASVTYNTSSDYRLKENVVTLSNAITRLKTLLPKRFNFISEPSVTMDGFLAHEVTAVPEAITGEKDAVDSEGNIDPQSIDHSKLVPLLTAALQEAITKIETLETKVAALEG